MRLVHMDATDLGFPDGTFDIVTASYVMTAVPDPVAVAREMRRVCHSGGHVVLLNHFSSDNEVLTGAARVLASITPTLGFKTGLRRDPLVSKSGLEAVFVDVPSLWSLAVCRRGQLPASRLDPNARE